MLAKRSLIALLVLFLLLLVVPFLLPMQRSIDRIEQEASARLGVPVEIGSLRVAILPSPRFHVGQLALGTQQEIRVTGITAVLDVTTLFSDVRMLSRLDVEKPVVRKAALDLLAAMGGKEGPALVTVRRVVVRDATLEWPDMVLPVFDVEAVMKPEGGLAQAVLSSTDGKLVLEVAPDGAGYAGHLQAQEWTIPVGPAILLQKLDADVAYAANVLQARDIRAALYRGRLNGELRLDWTRGWGLSGKFATEGIELAEASKLFSPSVYFSGRLKGAGRFSSQAESAGHLVDHLKLDYTFSVAKGVLHGMDLAKAASLFVKQGAKGGETEFDTLSGKVHVVGKRVDVRDLNVSSGLLAANGKVSVLPSKSLDGVVEVELKKGLALVTVPLKVSGTVDQPEVRPTKAALAGAAAGTAVLGPVGTSLGMKAGAALDKLLGDKK